MNVRQLCMAFGALLLGFPGQISAEPAAVPAEIALPVTEAQLFDSDKTPIAQVIREVAGAPVVGKEITVYWRLPETLRPGEYYPSFRIVQEGSKWRNEIWATVYHNARFVRFFLLTDPQPLNGALESEAYFEEPLRLAPGDVISAHFQGNQQPVLLRSLVLRDKRPAAGHTKIGMNAWGMRYRQPFKPITVRTTIASAPDENRSGIARITLFNYSEESRQVKVSWEIKDFFGKALDGGSHKSSIPSLGMQQWNVPYRIPDSSHHVLITARADDETGATVHHTTDVLADRIAGPRPRLYLSGAWDFAEDDSLFLGSPPAAGKFAENRVTVPGYMPLHHRGPKHVGWYRRTFIVPDWLTGERQILVFGTVAYECDVYLNGTKVGHHFGPLDAFEFDVTGKLEPGRNELVVGVRDWLAGVDPDTLRESASEKDWTDLTARRNLEIGRFMSALRAPSRDALGGIKDDVYLESRAPVQVTDVFIKPSVRNRSITVEVTLANRSGTPAKVTPVCTILDKGHELLRFSGQAVSLEPGAESTVSLQSPFQDAPLWWPHDPHLLQCAVSLRNGGDVADVRFGFREVSLGENSFLFNGRNAKMTRTGCNADLNRPAWRDAIASLPPFGVAIFEIANPFLMAAEVCDEEGVLWDLETNRVISYPTTQTLKNDVFWKNAEQMAARTARTFRNHACVVHHDHANEFGCFSPYTNVRDGYKFASKRLHGVYEAVRAIDPTRPGSSDADGDLDGRLPDFNLHYPIDKVPGMTVNGRLFLSPVDAFNVWFDEPRPDYVPQKGDVIRIKSNGIPLTWKWGTRPVYAPEVLWCPFSTLPHGGTYWKGDSVYRSTYDCYQAEVDRTLTLVAGHRHIGMWLVHPWTSQALKYEALKPDCVVPIEALRNYYGGESLIRPVNIHHDKLEAVRMTLRWGVTGSAGKTESGREVLAMEAGSLLRRKLEFVLPDVQTPTAATLYYRLEDDGAEVYSTVQSITIFPRTRVEPEQTIAVALWDPAGRSDEALSAIGAEISPVADPARIPDGTQTLVIGAEAWTEENCDETAGPLFGFVNQGGTLVILHQTHWPQWSPVRIRLDRQHVASRVWKRAPGHPVFRGIEDAWLHDWRQSHVVSSFDFVKPTLGNATALADSGVKDGLERCALLEIRYGTGRILASQFRLIESFDVEPAAPRLLANLLTAAATRSPALQPIAVCTAPGAPVVGMLAFLSADMKLLERPLSPAGLKAHNIILVQLDGTLTPAEGRALHERAAAGALVWVRGADAGTTRILEEITGCEWKEAGTPLDIWEGRAVIEGHPKALAGLSNGEFYWKRGNFGDLHGLEKPSWKIADLAAAYLQPAKTGSARSLLYPAAMWVVQTGEGRVLVDLVRWAEEQNPDLQNEARRIASALLTNAGVRLAPAERMAELPEDIVWQPIDLSPYANMGFADPVENDGKGGWTDQGPSMDMHRMPTGAVELNGIPFRLHPQKGCLTLRGNHQTMRDAFPTEIGDIPINRKVLALELLHAGAWAVEGLEVFKMIVNYKDGSRRAVQIVSGINSRDWTYKEPYAPFPLETETQTRCGWTGKGDVFSNVSVWQSRWLNPLPGTAITTIDFVHDPACVAMICGLTLGLEGPSAEATADARTPQELLEAAQQARAAGKLDEALATARLLCRKAPASTENWNLLGQLHMDRKDKSGALEAYRKSLSIQPNQPDTMTKVQKLQQSLDAREPGD